MKVVISASRFAPEVETLKKHLADLFTASGIGLTTYPCAEDGHGLSHVYFCEDHATNSNVMKQRDEIDPIIADADWVIVVVPLNHVGKYTNHEIQCAVKAFYENQTGAPVLSILNCIDYYNFDENKTNDKGYNIETFDNENYISIEQVKERIARTISEAKRECTTDVKSGLSDVFIEEYYYDKDNKNLKEKLTDIFQKNLADKKFRFLHLVAVSQLGKEVSAEDLYFNRERAKETNGFNEDKYYPRESVDGLLETAIEEQRKYIMLLGAPGSGKTRAIYQMLASSEKIELNGRSRFSMGRFSDKDIIVLRQDNVRKIYEMLKLEKSFSKYLEQCVYKWKPKEYILVCDQIKNVFQMLHENADLYGFFDLLNTLQNIRLIGTSIPSAFKKFAERWKDYGYNPMHDDERTVTITIPKISGDKDEIGFRNWIYSEFSFSGEIKRKGIETIGDCIENLYNYKETIVENLYQNSEYKYIGPLLSSIQTIETFRHDTALFLPIIVAKTRIKELYGDNEFESNFKEEIIKTINYLVANNVIWIANSEGIIMNCVAINNIIAKRKEFSLLGNEKYTFDGEVYDDPIFPTSFSYGVNEIIWEHLEKVDRERHLKCENSNTLLFDFLKKEGVIECAATYYSADERLSTLRRILPRIPRTVCQVEVLDELCESVFKICEKKSVENEENEFLLTMGILIGRAKNVDYIKKILNIIDNKGITPNYNIIGELYSACIRLGNEHSIDIENLIGEIRKKYKLSKNNVFSLCRELSYKNLDFEKSLDVIVQSELLIGGKYVEMKKYDEVIPLLNENKLELSNLMRLFDVLFNKAKVRQNWDVILSSLKSYKLCIKRKFIRQFFTIVSEENNKNEHKDNCKNCNLFLDNIKYLFKEYDCIIAQEDKKSPFYYAIAMAPDFKIAKSLYDYYHEKTNSDDSRLVSMVMSRVLDREFQIALLFLKEIDKRLKEQGSGLNNICFNNLIKVAPNADEAINILPYIPKVQEYTLASILLIIKNKRRVKDKTMIGGIKPDPKQFYYAYNVIMLDIFKDFRKNLSHYVIGLLYDLATTPKQEQFIRNNYLLIESEKKKLIDYSTGIASIRIKKNYRTLDQVWEIFNTCRNYYNKKKSYRASELYSNMLRKIDFLCRKENKDLQVEFGKMKKILEDDKKFIVPDEFFNVSISRYLDDKSIFDNDGNITVEFKQKMEDSNIQNIRIFNVYLFMYKDDGFSKIWNLYKYILDYYDKHSKWKNLRPDIRTFTYMLETVTTKEQFEYVFEEAKKRLSEKLYNSNKVFVERLEDFKKQFSTDSTLEKDNDKREFHQKKEDTKEVYLERVKEKKRFSTDSTLKKDNGKRDFYQKKEDTKEVYLERAKRMINSIKSDIEHYGSCTPTKLNKYLKNILEISNDKNVKHDIYDNLYDSLIKEKRDNLEFNENTYLSLIKLAPQNKCTEWINEMNKLNIEHNFVICREMATIMQVANHNIKISSQYFKYWQEIMNNIGYALDDKDSFTELSDCSKFNKIDDYDSFWKTYYNHTLRVMHDYYKNKDLSSLKFIKESLTLFKQYKVQIPVYNNKGTEVNFEKEIEEQGV